MNKYKVYGTVTVLITKEVYANSENEAKEVAAERFGGLANFCGNGGTDYLLGVYNDDEDEEETISCDDDCPNFYDGDVELLEEDVSITENFTVEVTITDYTPAEDATDEEIEDFPVKVYDYEIESTESDLEQDLINEIESDYPGFTVNAIEYTIRYREKV